MREILDRIDFQPKLCVWEITAQCNMRCLHCASNLDERPDRDDELDENEAIGVCRELKSLGCEKVVLSGGEALLRRDWAEIAHELVRLQVNVSLISNGWVLNEGIADQIAEIGLCRVGLSLDGLEETHNLVRQNNRSYSRVVSACSLLRSRGVPVNIVSHVNRRNLNELLAMEESIVALGASVWRLQLGSPVGRLARHPELHLTPADLPAIAGFILAAKRRAPFPSAWQITSVTFHRTSWSFGPARSEMPSHSGADAQPDV